MKTLRFPLLSLALFAPGPLLAGAFVVGNATGGPGSNVTIPLSFAGDGQTISSQVMVTVAAPLSIVSATPQQGIATCSSDGNSVTMLLFSFAPLPTNSANYCDVVLAIGPAAPPSPPTLPVTASGQLCATTGGPAVTCTATSGAVTVGAANAPPVIVYDPVPQSTITYSAAGTANPISAMPSNGAGSGSAATTTVGACTISGGGAAFPATSIGQLVFVGTTVVAQNLVLPNCLPSGQTPVNASLTCPEDRAGALSNRNWTLRCPAGDPVYGNGFE